MSVRVRFAPSPTGGLHVGGARTAYFNWLFARQRGGAFVLRSEDTDVARSSEASERGVLDDLRWLGLDWDEGPDIGGPHAPYRQSERLALYRGQAETLLAAGAAYPCFCADADLAERRAAALAAGRPPQYDGRCRALPREQAAARRRAGEPASLRLAVPAREVRLADAVRGEVSFPAGMVGDFVILRSSGLPTYNFACVVDDLAMQITHVIRAEEHLANTPRQLLLYAALAAAPPAFAHVPLILNPDRSKMSKREGGAAVAVAEWRRAGYVPAALLAHLALLGFHPGDEREVLSRDELLAAFALERVGRSGSVFDADKLRWVNAHFLHHADGAQLEAWIAAAGGAGAAAGREPAAGGAEAAAGPPPAAAALAEADAPRPAAGAADADWPAAIARQLAGRPPALRRQALETVRGNLATLADAPRELAALLDPASATEAEARAALLAPGAADLCGALAASLGRLAEWSAEAFKSTLQSIGSERGRRGRELYQPVRAALTGRTHGPELPLVAALLGRDDCVARLLAAPRRAVPGHGSREAS